MYENKSSENINIYIYRITVNFNVNTIIMKTLMYTEKNGIKLLHIQTKSATLYVHRLTI
jgi:hypothetical protein